MKSCKILLRLAVVDHRLITPYHPRANGAAEAWVKKTKETVSKRLDGIRGAWDFFLPSTQLALTTKYPNVPNDDGPLADLNVEDPLKKNRSNMENVLFPTIRKKSFSSTAT
ncbi:hypothetical protein O0I10_008710 [Lichtheimia ornata]|uniref:Integrase catalytic domain-containing protein n=1 Tax=Lichtheimia ornata TaxID=688661 RepID=A0AAD7UZS5_9FUNG|nr:uncharacterized protein O0I10_008710 [Lichtheimia ornata]KAJ8655622.1 hypothetical protein O0I10_008710 [Lichtheimia ornata]